MYEFLVGDIVAFKVDGALFAGRIVGIEDIKCRQMANVVNLSEGCNSGVKGKFNSGDSCRPLTREENQRYHEIMLNGGKPLKHYQGDFYVPAGTCMKAQHFIFLTSVDIPAEEMIENMELHDIYDLETKSMLKLAQIGFQEITFPSDEEEEEYWNAIYEILKSKNKK